MSTNTHAQENTLTITKEIARIIADAIARSVKDMDIPSREILIDKLRTQYERYKKSNYYFVCRIPTIYIPLLETGEMPENEAFIECQRATKLRLDRLLEEFIIIREVFLPKAEENPQT